MLETAVFGEKYSTCIGLSITISQFAFMQISAWRSTDLSKLYHQSPIMQTEGWL